MTKKVGFLVQFPETKFNEIGLAEAINTCLMQANHLYKLDRINNLKLLFGLTKSDDKVYITLKTDMPDEHYNLIKHK